MQIILKMFTIAAALAFAPCVHANILDWANGTWAAPDDDPDAGDFICSKKPMTASTNASTQRYRVDYFDGSGESADILQVDGKSFALQYDGEERVMDDGQIQIWHMYFIDKNTFVWVRDDWIKDNKITGYTARRIRCDKPIVS